MGEGKKIMLNLGSGNRPRVPGFTHIDYQTGGNIDIVGSIADLGRYMNKSVEMIYSSHAFEYFHLDEAPYVLKEWHRVLKKYGLLRISVPDFEKLIQVYLASGDI